MPYLITLYIKGDFYKFFTFGSRLIVPRFIIFIWNIKTLVQNL